MKVNQKNWSCPRKRIARVKTIFEPYKEFFKQSAIPHEQQYWTMCGQCGDDNGNPINGSEVSHILQNNFVSASQIRGVETNEKIHALNKIAYPEISFIENDFHRAMEDANNVKEFNPGFINLDTTRTYERAAEQLDDIMAMLKEIEHTGPLMIVTNVVIAGKHLKSCTADEAASYVLSKIQKHRKLEWHHDKNFYQYNGTGKSSTKMCSIILAKK